jgi:hypothetical protein
MKKNPDQKQDDPEQSKRFLEAAKVAGADEWQADFEKAFAKLNLRKATTPKRRAAPSRPPGK